MALYFVEYDVRAKNHDYQPLWDELKRLNAVRVLKSLWSLKNNASVTDIRDHFRKFMHNDDGIAVVQADNWATYNTEDTPKSLAA